MDDWPAMRKWNLDYFAAEIRRPRGRGADGPQRRRQLRNRAARNTLTRSGSPTSSRGCARAGETNDFYLTANNNSSQQAGPARAVGRHRADSRISRRATTSGGFFWMGPAGTITPFHHDLTNNFMAAGDRPQADQDRSVLGHAADAQSSPLLFSGRRPRHAARASTRPRRTPDPGMSSSIRARSSSCPIGCLHFVEGVDISVTVSFTNFVFDNDFSSFYSTYHGV